MNGELGGSRQFLPYLSGFIALHSVHKRRGKKGTLAGGVGRNAGKGGLETLGMGVVFGKLAEEETRMGEVFRWGGKMRGNLIKKRWTKEEIRFFNGNFGVQNWLWAKKREKTRKTQ